MDIDNGIVIMPRMGGKPRRQWVPAIALSATVSLLTACDSQPRLIASDQSEVCLRGGVFTLGAGAVYPEERPEKQVRVRPFCIDRYEVTNADFRAFVTATDYVTVAERGPSAADYPQSSSDLLTKGSAVFVTPQVGSDGVLTRWWVFSEQANWRNPLGEASDLAGKGNHPVVHIAYADAQAYAKWRGRDLPTEAEWEFAARGGLEGRTYAWGDTRAPDGEELANTWQGAFPVENLATDGFAFTAPVGSFPANGFGLYDMIGNVWEWTTTSYGNRSLAAADRRTIKGGSFLCAPSYCARYRPAAKQAQETGLGTNHIGFRTVRRR
ncbi:MAG: formylglycine-generating enzyme family protein [Pseudomonadota bacterium]